MQGGNLEMMNSSLNNNILFVFLKCDDKLSLHHSSKLLMSTNYATNKSYWKCAETICTEQQFPLTEIFLFYICRSATSPPPSTSTTGRWPASAAGRSSGGPSRTRQPPPTCAGGRATARLTWGLGKIVNFAGNNILQIYMKTLCTCFKKLYLQLSWTSNHTFCNISFWGLSSGLWYWQLFIELNDWKKIEQKANAAVRK